MTVVTFEPEAEEELEAALAWYEQRSAGLGLRLMVAIDGVVMRIAALPRAFSEVPGVQAPVPVRRAIVPGFPYSVAYVELDAEIRVIAIAHAKRRPSYWLNRLQR